MQQDIIGIDIGTGSAKAVALDSERNVIAVTQSFYGNNKASKQGYSEQDTEVVWTAFVKCMQEINEKLNHLPVIVSFSSCMHSLVAVDKNNTALTPLITWADSRSEKIAEALRKTKKGKNIYKVTGTPIHSMSPLCKIKWLKENEKEIFKNTFKFISIKEFIWYRLFNKYEIDYSIASATGLFNIKKLKWNIESLSFCGIDKLKLSKVVSTDFIRTDVNASLAKLLDIKADTQFCIGASDGCLANLGTIAIEPGIAALTIGTSGAIRIAGPTPIVNYKTMVFNYLLDDETFISGGPVNNGGNILKWMFKTFLNNSSPSDNDYENVFNQIELIPPGSNGLIFLPYLYGERAPIWDEKASGLFFGIRSFHNNAHFFRAALEGICFALKSILEIIETSADIKQLNVSGGFVRSKIWLQLLADITGKNLCLVQTEDASSIGAALLAMKSLKIIDNYLPQHSSTNKVVSDSKNKSSYKKYYNIFKKLYKPSAKYMHQLQDIRNPAEAGVFKNINGI